MEVDDPADFPIEVSELRHSNPATRQVLCPFVFDAEKEGSGVDGVATVVPTPTSILAELNGA
jgi:hypothetical protein